MNYIEREMYYCEKCHMNPCVCVPETRDGQPPIKEKVKKAGIKEKKVFIVNGITCYRMSDAVLEQFFELHTRLKAVLEGWRLSVDYAKSSPGGNDLEIMKKHKETADMLTSEMVEILEGWLFLRKEEGKNG